MKVAVGTPPGRRQRYQGAKPAIQVPVVMVAIGRDAAWHSDLYNLPNSRPSDNGRPG